MIWFIITSLLQCFQNLKCCYLNCFRYRLEWMESCGAGIQKILESYANCGIEPEFSPAPASFAATLPNRNIIKRRGTRYALKTRD